MEDRRSGSKAQTEAGAETDAGAGGDSRRRARIGDRAGRRDRRGQGDGQGVCAVARQGRAPVQPGLGRAGHHRRGRRPRRAVGRPAGGAGQCGVDIGLLAHLLLPAGGGRAEGGPGQCPRCEERAGPAQDRPPRCGVAGQADREGAAAAVIRATAADPAVARLHPVTRGPDPRTHPLLAAAGEAARGRPDQGVVGDFHPEPAVGARHDRSPHRRRARPAPVGRSGPGPVDDQARGPDRRARWPLRRPPRRADPDAAGPDRRPHRPDRHPHPPHRGTRSPPR